MSYAIVGPGSVRAEGQESRLSGGLSEGGLLMQAHGKSRGQLIFKDLVKFDG